MAIQETDHIWANGQLIPWRDATVHVLTHALHYGTSIFEGIRVYDTPQGACGFRLTDHIQRWLDSAAIYQLALGYDRDTLVEACRELVRANGLNAAYLRPIAFVGYGQLGVTPTHENPIEVYIAAFPWAAYLGAEGQKTGVDACISSWNRNAPNTAPAAAKAGGNYLVGALIGQEAKQRGFAEGIGLSVDGRLSEGAGENLFLVHKGRLLTPPACSSILQGITRDSVLTLARAEGIEVVEQEIPREMLYVCDEAFFTGTAVEITPISSVDHRPTRSAGPGPVTRLLQERFFGLFSGETPDRFGWLEPISEAASTSSFRPRKAS